MGPIIIIGGSGFIGQSLLRAFDSEECANISILLRNSDTISDINLTDINIVQGDLFNETALDALIQPGATVINLVYINDLDTLKNIDAINTLTSKCKSVGIKRFIHCSTTSVYGDTNEVEITEKTKCNPKTEYEKTKYKIENLLEREANDHFELIIIRPTAVFGPNGKNLIKFIEAFKFGNPVINYFRACLYSKRRMNLVSINTVVSSIKFLIEVNISHKQETYIVSEDEEAKNNFYDIEKMIREFMYIKYYSIPVIKLPSIILKLFLKFKHRSNVNPETRFSSKKIQKLGFRKLQSFEKSLQKYIEYYQEKL